VSQPKDHILNDSTTLTYIPSVLPIQQAIPADATYIILEGRIKPLDYIIEALATGNVFSTPHRPFSGIELQPGCM
jgi:hypothetical protein